MIIKTVSMVLPVLIMLCIGMVCKKKNILSRQGLDGIRAIVGNILLPVVLFNAFFTAEYNMRMLLVFCVSYVGFGIAFGMGFLLRKTVSPYGKYMPFLVTSAEVGMLGYALFALIAGSAGTSTLAIVDVGQTVFSYTIWVTTLKALDGKKMTAKDVVLNFVHTGPAMGMLCGIVLGMAGLGKLLLSCQFAPIYTQAVSFITAPTGALILIIVGFDMAFTRKIIKPVCVTALLRVLILGVVCVAGALVVFSFTPFDKELLMAMVLTFSLPAPFIIPLFTEMQDDAAYVSTTYSVETICTILLFIPLVVYSLV